MVEPQGGVPVLPVWFLHPDWTCHHANTSQTVSAWEEEELAGETDLSQQRRDDAGGSYLVGTY